MKLHHFPYEIHLDGSVTHNGRPIKKIKKGNREVVHLYNKAQHTEFYVDELMNSYFPQWEPTDELKQLMLEAMQSGKLTKEEIKEIYDYDI